MDINSLLSKTTRGFSDHAPPNLSERLPNLQELAGDSSVISVSPETHPGRSRYNTTCGSNPSLGRWPTYRSIYFWHQCRRALALALVLQGETFRTLQPLPFFGGLEPPRFTSPWLGNLTCQYYGEPASHHVSLHVLTRRHLSAGRSRLHQAESLTEAVSTFCFPLGFGLVIKGLNKLIVCYRMWNPPPILMCFSLRTSTGCAQLLRIPPLPGFTP